MASKRAKGWLSPCSSNHTGSESKAPVLSHIKIGILGIIEQPLFLFYFSSSYICSSSYPFVSRLSDTGSFSIAIPIWLQEYIIFNTSLYEKFFVSNIFVMKQKINGQKKSESFLWTPYIYDHARKRLLMKIKANTIMKKSNGTLKLDFYFHLEKWRKTYIYILSNLSNEQ